MTATTTRAPAHLPHTLDEDFDHFCAYKGISPAKIGPMSFAWAKQAFEAAWAPSIPPFPAPSWSALLKLRASDPVIDLAIEEWQRTRFAGEPDAFLLALVGKLSERNAELQGQVADAMVRSGK